jgi:uncharacterized protein (DUF427 family)
VETVSSRLLVIQDGARLADAPGGYRVLETSHPPCYYLPPDSVDWSRLSPSGTVTYCEFKGYARYWDLIAEAGRIADVAWAYDEPTASHRAIAGSVSFYAGRVDACYVGDEPVTPQAGRFYGGWITPGITGPFKGAPGTRGW